MGTLYFKREVLIKTSFVIAEIWSALSYLRSLLPSGKLGDGINPALLVDKKNINKK